MILKIIGKTIFYFVFKFFFYIFAFYFFLFYLPCYIGSIVGMSGFEVFAYSYGLFLYITLIYAPLNLRVRGLKSKVKRLGVFEYWPKLSPHKNHLKWVLGSPETFINSYVDHYYGKETLEAPREETREETPVGERYPTLPIPPRDIIISPDVVKEEVPMEFIKEKGRAIHKVLKDYKITGTKIPKYYVGPNAIQYLMVPAQGVKIDKYLRLEKELAVGMGVEHIKMDCPVVIDGKSYISIEIASPVREMIPFADCHSTGWNIPIGKSIQGEMIYKDIRKMPHLLVAGTTGSGKSVFIQSIIGSILRNTDGNEARLYLIDPKQVEFGIYEDMTDRASLFTTTEGAKRALEKLVDGMEKTYAIFKDMGVRNIEEFNQIEELDNLPYRVIVIDEFSDLIGQDKSIEGLIVRLAQKARAAGFHIIMATQRPSVDVVTGLIKANFPTRISFTVRSAGDSQTILGFKGAECLTGWGDMLFLENGKSQAVRLQGCYASDDDLRTIANYWK